MSNIANIQPLKYCQCKMGNRSKCANIATYQIRLKSDKSSYSEEWQYRCEDHKNKNTVHMKVFKIDPLDQEWVLQTINRYLKTIIGKNITSKMHTAKQLNVRYIKPNTGGIMCFQEHSKKWKFVYYDQIESIL